MKISRFLYKITEHIADYFGLYLASKVQKANISLFLSKLHPIHCGNNLVRIGPEGDGGYLIPDDLDGITACYSPGVDMESRFEFELAERGMEVFLADYSVIEPGQYHPNFRFVRKFLASFDYGYYMSMDSWVNNSVLVSEGDFILQMDIEGAEYQVLHSTSTRTIQNFRIIVIEFHGWNQLYKPEVFQNVNSVISKLLLTHEVVHIHPNNNGRVKIVDGISLFELLEITFIRKDRIITSSPVLVLPNLLDRSNVSNKEKIVLTREWYSPGVI